MGLHRPLCDSSHSAAPGSSWRDHGRSSRSSASPGRRLPLSHRRRPARRLLLSHRRPLDQRLTSHSSHSLAIEEGEPDIGSDLAHLKTRGKLKDDKYLVNGNKTWITHGARADLMTLLVRTNSELSDHKGLSMFLAEKPRENDNEFFPADGMSGGEINVIGYRGMKEFDIGFDNFEVPKENLLGEKARIE